MRHVDLLQGGLLSDSWSSRSNAVGIDSGCWCRSPVDGNVGAVLGDMTWLATFVARLARSVQRASIGSGAITGDVALRHVS